jgi:hypothetical protein
MSDDVAKIAKGLTKAQRAALVASPWSMMKQYDAGILDLLLLGLLQRDGLGHSLSPLGLAVRAHLERTSDDR